MADLGRLDRVDLLDLLGLGQALHQVDLDGALRVAAPAEQPDCRYPEEGDLVARAVAGRRREFLTGRNLARAALADLGVPPGPIGRRPDRSPAWPSGVIGSISHTDGLVAAAVARPRRPGTTGGAPERLVGLGLDVEVDQPLPEEVAARVLRADERLALGTANTTESTVVFSAKESVFKAVNPMTGRWLEPEDVEIRLDPDGTPASGPAGSGTFEARLAMAGPDDPSLVAGRWVRLGGWVVTACVARAGRGRAVPEP